MSESNAPTVVLPPDGITREAARTAGYKKFWGNPCVHGHDGLRMVGSTTCYYCIREARKTHKQKLKQEAKFSVPGRPSEIMVQVGVEALEKALAEGHPPDGVVYRVYLAMRSIPKLSSKKLRSYTRPPPGSPSQTEPVEVKIRLG